MKYKVSSTIVVSLVAIVVTGCNGSGNGSQPSSSTGGGSSGGIGESAGSTSKAAGTPTDPIIIKGASSLENESTTKSSDNVSGEDSTCVDYKTAGPDQVYKITVPGADTTKLTVTVTPSEGPGPDAYDLVAYVTESIAPVPSCKSGSDSRGGGGAEIVEYVNTNGQDTDVYIVVDGYDYQKGGGNFKLVTDIAAP